MPDARQTVPHRGCSLSYFTRGEGPPVLFIQGTGVAAEGWLPQIDALAKHFRCAAFDNRGFGPSQPLSEPLTLELMADDALAVMDALGWKSAHVVGHSLGGLIAQFVAHRAPERVRSLSLLCTFANGAIPTRLTWSMLKTGMRTRIGTRRMRRHAFLELTLAPHELATNDRDALAEQLGALFGHDLADSPPVVMKQLGAMSKADATPFLASLAKVPTFVLAAEHDRIAPLDAGRALARAIPGARLFELAGAAHGGVITRADEVNALLREHIENAEAPRATA
ncbi:MAG: alpha/beta hydrolase [Deltaproteobacteria bacterium]|nr:alpha/beta hydrolase [Deltaproteobacteria bacterium]